ncbi:phosphoribosylamine--glycine ligase [Oscillatoria salina]|uniref:phosphoribosylamine--glycine ligase n=1 Tax=Oscillatoria salina TaxID=331517 RepID=UPI0013BA014E|nr:phosphoribosylamine--glycine ligase [Oscillatoria salina]MBZ8182780.1 phosphoribosylamine--glycine ligase [Oscillatoria salina IIICB1]NET90457.1 phosphoribosylamine--glycine ligase [Kamptonema sp. SIO1D9]
MKVLVVGSGGREHALAWKLLQSKRITGVYCVPGNGGTAVMKGCKNLPLRVDDFEGISRFLEVHGIPLVVVGPELPLSMGIADYLKDLNVMVFGPNKAGAQIEASKSWAKELMLSANVPTPKAEMFAEAETAIAYVEKQGAPIVIKADGLAAGKGVIVAQTVPEATTAIASLFQKGFSKVLVEEYLTGQEVSVLALTDGKTVRPLLPAQDHKRIGEGDTGENTGGMGAYAPAPIVTPELMSRIEREILQPTVEALVQRGIDYRGVLYAGLMITPEGTPKVLEFNCRFGDPETQAILPLLDTPLEQLFIACCEGKLAEQPPIAWKQGSAITVVASSPGYPGKYQKGLAIAGIEQAENFGAIVFHAGTKLKQQQLVTDGGRVLNVTAVGENFSVAKTKAYQGIEKIQFEGIYYRRDIGHRLVSANFLAS